MAKSAFKYGISNSNRKRWRELKKSSEKSHEETEEFFMLEFQKEAGLKEAYGVKVSKQVILEALFGPNPYKSEFKETAYSSKWDSLVVNLGFNEELEENDGIVSRLRFFDGSSEVPDVLPDGGGGLGANGTPTPPPM